MAQEFKTPLELKEGEPFLVTLKRVPYVTKQKHGEHPVGTTCFAQRKNPPDFNIILEFEDGTSFELPEHYHLEGYESSGESPYAVEDRRTFAYLAWKAERRSRYNRDPVI